jgi:predicted alpha/beta superfamily hydrolase
MTDRTRDLTPTHADIKNPDGTVTAFPTSGGADRFLDFIQTELIPEIEKRYRTAPYRIFAGRSLGGLLAIHALFTRPDLFNAYIAVSPSSPWRNQSCAPADASFSFPRYRSNARSFARSTPRVCGATAGHSSPERVADLRR